MINFLTWNKAYAVFPQSTFINRNGVALRRLDEFFQSHAEKYKKRNYRISGLRSPDSRRSTSEIAEIRRPGDRLTWRIPFDTTGIEAPKTPDYVLEHSAFGFEQTKCDTDDFTLPYSITALTFEACVLRYRYTLPNCPDFFDSIQAKMDRLTFEELQKLPKTLRPRSYLRMIRNPWKLHRYRDGLFDRGTSRLTCYDEKIPAWYAEWERKTPRTARISMK